MREVTPLIWADLIGRHEPMGWSWVSFSIGVAIAGAVCIVFALVMREVLIRKVQARAEEYAARLVAESLASGNPVARDLSALVAQLEDESPAFRALLRED